MNNYIEKVLAATKAKNANEPEFLQTVEEVLGSRGARHQCAPRV